MMIKINLGEYNIIYVHNKTKKNHMPEHGG
jgi:hypothetical protein